MAIGIPARSVLRAAQQGNGKPVQGVTPAAVAQGRAATRGRHDPNHVLNLNVGLGVHNSAQLDALIQAASTPGDPLYGHYLTNEQYMAQYAPTAAEVQAAVSWLTSQGLTVTGTTADNLLVHVRASAKAAEQAFGVSINDYTAEGRSFHSNDHDPIVPAGLNVSWVSGLSNFDVFKTNSTCTPNPGSKCGYDGGDFRAAYDIPGDGKGTTIGFTLWGESLPQSDYDGYAAATGDTALTIGQAGDDGLDFITVDGSTNESDTDAEVALDTQIAHGVAPGSHLTYWLGHDNSNSTLEDVLNAAVGSSIKIFSNSWGAQSSSCPVDSNMESTLQKAASMGKTFYFSTGDSGASAGCQYPAVSQYVVAVGGTQLNVGAGSSWSSETAIQNGGGCTNSVSRPSWQTGIGSPLIWQNTACTGRAEPDVAANSGIGAYLYYDGSPQCCIGGTSLATPIWAALSVIWNKNNAATGRPGIGFSAPLIYQVANDATAYANDFHDITSGSNGFNAVAGWDEATGWGSPDFNKLSNNPIDIAYTGPVQASKGDTITLSGTLYDKGTTNGLANRKISFAAAGEFCDATTDGTGRASCSVTINDSPGHYSAIAAFAGDAAWVAGSDTKNFTVLHIPTTVTYIGPASQDYNDAVTLIAKLTDNSNGAGISSEQLSFTLGAESCKATTNNTGVASCSVTPLDIPGSYTVSVSFAGDEPVYEPSSVNAPFTVKKEDSKVAYTGPLTSHYHDALTATATLIDPDDNTPIANKTVVFKLGATDTCSAMTTAQGKASCSITPTQTGTQNIVAAFAGDTFYLASSDTKSFVITPEETTTTYTGPKVILAGAGSLTLTATLVEDGAADNDGDGGSVGPAPAESVTLSIGSQSCIGTTNSAGAVSCTISSVTVPLGPETVKATFAGDAFYQASSDSASVIVFAFPSRGVFELGDITAATAGSSTVTWWGDTWWQLDALSGGSAPSQFKGFANMITLPTTTPPASCGSAWTSSGGNSPPPVSGVPSYMGVVVTSSVKKNGSTSSGNSKSIVVVKVNPGYTPDPSGHGTGTIVATFCTN